MLVLLNICFKEVQHSNLLVNYKYSYKSTHIVHCITMGKKLEQGMTDFLLVTMVY